MTARADLPLAERRASWRKAWHRQQWMKWAARVLAEGLETCPARNGHTVCGGTLTSLMAGNRSVPHCERCDRKRRRLCLDCASSLAGEAPRALFCATCRRLHRFEVTAKSRAAHGHRSAEKYRQKSPDERAEHNQRSALYRLAKPGATERHIAKQRARRQADPAVLARTRELSKASRERVKAGLAKRERYTADGERLCRTSDCVTVMRHTKQRWCPPCKAARVRAARQRLTGGTPHIQPTRAAS